MFEFKFIRNASGMITHIETELTGQALLNASRLNKGCAFTEDERDIFQLSALLPHQIETLEQQVTRMYAQFQEHRTNLTKNIYLNVLHDYNETLFYRLASEHLEEMLPIIYTPTVGEAVQRFSLELRKTKGLYISYADRHSMDELLDERAPPEADISVVTDGGAVLGIGDQGIGGINISSAKLMVYTLCGGINPHRVLPIQLDVGTDNPHLLNDPMYLGWRHERITGQEYDDFVNKFVTSLLKKFPDIYLHWEDFGRGNARRILERYRGDILTLNGDMQATGVVALSCVLSGVHASGIPLKDHRIVVFGGGTAGIGIADQIFGALVRSGLSEKEARSRIWVVDKEGLLTKQSEHLADFQKPHARDEAVTADNLTEVVKIAKPTILIGCSTASGAFTEEIVNLMCENSSRPIIMPLSNPTQLAEATPEDLIKWTKAKALIATGSPFPNVLFEDKTYRVSQSNNAFAFPGIGLGVIACKAKRLTDDMLWEATKALSECAPVKLDVMSPLLPKLSEARMVSINVAHAVAEQARKEGLAQVPDNADLRELIEKTIWEPRYYPYKKRQK